jgi:DNA repair exonuclease SbcCD ATPase subunit
MRLLKLSLENWRGVDSRHVVFSEGVTLIEGPNEIGKSTIVEAIRMLFNELDSSKKQSVKAIMPVDQDVGSTVEIEVTSGEYHFVYSKTFNKTDQTTLNVLAPKKKQVTGREAHDVVAQMLSETVDMALWEALLVDQGEKVALANIQDSAGLAKALDDAAGAAATGSDDTDLFEAAQAEYERYFTLKAGKSRFAAEEAAFEKAGTALKAAQQALAEVETTAQAHERSVAEVFRIKAELPRLKEIADEHGKNWQTIKSLKETVTAKGKELADARAIQGAAIDVQKNRLDLVEDVSISQRKVVKAREELEPLQLKADKFKDQTKSAQLVITDLRKQAKRARAEFDLAHADEQHLQTVETLAKEQTRLNQLQEIAKDKTSSLQVAGSIQINDAALEQLRESEGRVAIARGTRNTAATKISVTAESKLVMEMDGEEISLDDAEVETRTIASQFRLRLPGVAAIEITPPQSVAELQAELEESEEALSRLMSQFGVDSLKDAVAANEKRADAQRNVDRLKAREGEILDETSVEEIEQAVVSYQAECVRYVEHRQSQQDLPAGLADASNRVSAAKSELASREAALEKAQEKADALQKEYGDLDGQLRIAQQNLAGLEAALADKEERLTKLRSDGPDAALAERASEATANVDQLESESATQSAKLNNSSPDSVEALMTNAHGAWERAKFDLIEEKQDLAVLEDRLQQAQADGRFEAKEAAERDLEESQRTLESTRRRAEAIELLWNTLNRHRNAARKTYVRPLKEAIERLGKIVFGSGFEIEIGDDWTVLTRTLNGLTLPFEYLSVGAKEQLGILARLAAAQIVAKHGGVPLIIDDALGFSDPSRLETIGAAITAAGKESQIIILTCTPGRFTHVGSAEVVRF